MELDLSPTPLVIKYGGQRYQMRMPSQKDLANYGSKIDGLSQSDQAEAMREFIISLGLPGDVYDKLEVGKITLLVETLLEKKMQK